MRAVWVAMIALAVAAAASGVSLAAGNANSFAISHVDVFDGRTVKRGQDVIVKDGLIEAVGAHLPLPAGLTITEGAGKLLLPGLIDSHVHSWGSSRSDALRFGVTTELDMFMDWHALSDARTQRQTRPQTAQADLWSSGTLATAAGGHGTEYGIPIPTLSEARQAQAWVDGRLVEGSDYIKIVIEPGSPKHPLPTLSPAIVTALVSAAHHAGKLAVVHVQTLASARVALEAGADGLAHIFDDQLADNAFVKLARQRHLFVIPTLAVYSASSCGPLAASLASDPAIKPYLSSAQSPMLAANFGSCTPSDLKTASQNVRILHEGGIPLLAGTDAGNPGTAHGVSLLGEIELLTQAGLTAVEAWAAATSVPAEHFGLKDRGRIERGRRADLLLVEGDPTAAAVSLRHIAAIWMNGYPVTREVSAQSEAANRIPATYQRVTGQAAAQTPGNVYAGQINIVDGTLEVKLAGDEAFKGESHPVDPKTSAPVDLAKDWDVIYGAGYYAKHVQGNAVYVRALMVSNSGATLVTEIIRDASNGYAGAARDSRGNLYKVGFGE